MADSSGFPPPAEGSSPAEGSPPPVGDDNVAALKVPPNSVEAEMAVLGGLMLDNSKWEDVAEVLIAADFYRAEHRCIYGAMLRQSEAGQPMDLITLAEDLKSRGELEAAGGADYLGGLVEGARGTANIVAYSEIIRERAILRSLISTAHGIADSGYNTHGQVAEEVLDEAERQVLRIRDERPRQGGPKPGDALLTEAVEHLSKLAESEDGIIGLPSGYKDLDKLTAGWQDSDLIVVAGRPSMGKSAFAMNLVERVIAHQSLPVLVFSLEMPGTQLVLRMIASMGRIDYGRLRNGQLSNDDWDKMTEVMGELKDKPLYIDDTPGLSPMEMRSRVRRVMRKHDGMAMVVLDYLQLMHIKDTTENRVNEISEISRSLKLMAREFKCPVVALSQLNRGVENRPDKRPMLSDLRESGAIEQDADVILFLYRDERYNDDTEKKGVAEVIIGKQRNGPTGMVELSFLDRFTRFEDHAKPRYDDSYTHDA